MTLAKKLTGTLTAGSTTIIFTDELINNDSIIEVYTQSDNVYPADITQSENSVTILFDRQSVNVGVAIMIINLTQLDEPGDIALSNLSDVTITSLASSQMLIWNGTKWVNADLPSIPTVPDELNDLTDVTITSPAVNQVLTYDGDEWVNGDIATSNVYDKDNDVIIGKWYDGRNIKRHWYQWNDHWGSSGRKVSPLSLSDLGADIVLKVMFVDNVRKMVYHLYATGYYNQNGSGDFNIYLNDYFGSTNEDTALVYDYVEAE